MKQIRHKVFETNSSSTHSVTLYYNYNVYYGIEADEDGDIYLKPCDIYDIMRQNLQDFTLEEIQELLNAKVHEITNPN